MGGETSEFKPVSDAEDSRIPSLLTWLYNNVVHGVPGNDVVAYEQVVYFVRETVFEREPNWRARIKCFNVWDQEDMTVIFEIAGPNKSH